MEAVDSIYKTLCRQGEAILDFAESFEEKIFNHIIDILYSTSNSIFVTGVGKSGNIAAKIASTLTSTGTKAYYLSPTEALHGDLGMVSVRDIVIIVSKSGETQEILDMLDYLVSQSVFIISITCNPESTIALSSSIVVPYRAQECCGTNFIPTTSTTVALAIGDAIAIALMKQRGFKVEDFASFHPGGSLGKAARDSIGEVEFPHEKS
jgi:arabinose-5-phosphate isomerase